MSLCHVFSGACDVILWYFILTNFVHDSIWTWSHAISVFFSFFELEITVIGLRAGLWNKTFKISVTDKA